MKRDCPATSKGYRAEVPHAMSEVKGPTLCEAIDIPGEPGLTPLGYFITEALGTEANIGVPGYGPLAGAGTVTVVKTDKVDHKMHAPTGDGE